MIIERNDNEIIIKLPSNIGTTGFQRIINYLKYKEATVDSSVDEEEVNKFADESKKNWWAENKHRLLSEYCNCNITLNIR